MARLAIAGVGPVGLVTSMAFALDGHAVVAFDVDSDRVDRVMKGELPVYEPGVDSALKRTIETGHFTATQELDEAVPNAEIIFICVGTPSRHDGSMDVTFLNRAMEDIVSAAADNNPIIVVKSTVLPGTTERLVRPILESANKPFGLAVNPEFLREGHALEDSLNPDRIILGVDTPATAKRLRELYASATCPIIETDLRTAEAIKYATNAFLATKVAFANELADLCAALGVAYDDVIEGVKLDPRVNPRFLVPGVGFGGSCFPKDVRALVAAGKAAGHAPTLLEAVLRQNETQHLQAIRCLEEELGSLEGARIALLGLAFKGNTDDVRESRAVPLARTLLAKGATVVGYDPKANANFHALVPEIPLATSAHDALQGAHGCILQADWPEFTQLQAQDFLETMEKPVVVDGRRILDPTKMEGVRLRRIGDPRVL